MYLKDIIRGDNIMKNRLKDMRLKRGISQKILGIEIGVSQQNISKYENDIASIPIDVLIAMSEYFKVSTDYILGLSDERYNLKMQMTFNKEVDEYYEIIELYKRLDTKNKKLVFHILTKMNELMADKKG